MLSDSDREQAERGSLILHRLVPAPDHGAGFRRDPETGFVYYSSEWLGDEREIRNPEWIVVDETTTIVRERKPE
jgi:hypothetical protein